MRKHTYLAERAAIGVEFLDAAIAQIVSACQRARRLETGGILLGHYNERHDRAIIVEGLGPPKDSRAGSTWFQRGVAGVEAVLRARWKARPRLYYLGEWHYHPMASAAPSRDDLHQMGEIAADRGYRCPEPLMVILGGDPGGPWELSVTIVPRVAAPISLRRDDRRPRTGE